MLRRWEQRLGVRGVTLLLSVPLGIVSALLCGACLRLPDILWRFVEQNEWIDEALHFEGIRPGLLITFEVTLVLCTVILFSAFVLGLVRRLWALTYLRFAYACAYFTGIFYLYVICRIGGAIEMAAGVDYNLEFHFGTTESIEPLFSRLCGGFSYSQLFNGIDKVTVFKTLYAWSWPIALLLLGIGMLHLTSWRRMAIAVYRGYHDDADEPGDEVLENLRTHGSEPEYRKRLYLSILTHLMVIVIIPWLLQFIGCVTPYRVPKGSGNPVVAMVQVSKPKKEKKKRYILNPESLVAFKIPEIDDSEIFQTVEQQTLLTYKASANAKAGKMGKGGGKTGGWPDGMEDHLVRFIRLKHDGPDWDDGMEPAQGADQNFLAEFERLTGFNVAKEGEAHRMRLLSKYPKGYAPPFVYLTGSGRISASGSDIEALREYLFDGGMLFADAGSEGFDSSFRSFIRQVVPGYPLLNIADDDPIFLMPYTFPHGAPPLWHHGGKRALGVKYKNRWIVFYHPGDVNDAWKNGHSGIGRTQAEGAFNMGVNIVYYAFSNYLEETRKYRR